MSIQGAIAAVATAPAQSNNVMTEALMRINDAHQNQEWSLSRAEAQGEAANDSQPSVAGCQPSTGERAVFTNELPDRVETSNMIVGMMNRMGNVQGSNTQYGTFAGLTKDALYEIQQYGNSSELCTSGASGCSVTNGPMPDANVRADTLFQDTYVNGTPVGSSINATETQWQNAAKDYCANLTNTGDLDPLQNSVLGSPQGITEFSLRKAGDARMSLTQLVCSEMVAEREPNTNSTWGQKIMNNLVSTFNLPSGIATSNFSSYQLTKLLAHDQFADPNWDQMVASESSPTAVLRLMNTLEAASLQMQWKEYDSLERIKLLEAVSLASETEKTRKNVPATALPAN
jgi:hypothetical protein